MPHRRRTPGRGRPALRALLATALAMLLTGAVVAATAAPALALPPPPPRPTDRQIDDAAAQQQAAAEEVGRIAGLVAQAEAKLEEIETKAEAAGAAYLAAQDALDQAQAAANRTADQLRAATADVAAAQARIASFSHDSYINGRPLTSSAALLDSAGPGELIQRAAMLHYVASTQLDVLGQLQIARVQQANADSEARGARDRMAAAEETAAAAKAAVDQQLAVQKSAYDQIAAQKDTLDQQLQAAQIRLLELQGARNAYDQWVRQKQAEEAAAREAQARAAKSAADKAAAARASGGGATGWVLPAAGRTSSCYGARWGVVHYGIDIAAPIGTAIYAAHSGVVQRAGSATGFGLAVYIRGNDGSVTVYGHVNRYFVEAGDRVVAGQQIAEVGNRGQSTGPHLHFEVHPNGEMYSGAVNPAPWLRARGVDISGC